jgi:hypothetical protein
VPGTRRSQQQRSACEVGSGGCWSVEWRKRLSLRERPNAGRTPPGAQKALAKNGHNVGWCAGHIGAPARSYQLRSILGGGPLGPLSLFCAGCSGDPQLVSRAGTDARLTGHATQQNRAAASGVSPQRRSAEPNTAARARMAHLSGSTDKKSPATQHRHNARWHARLPCQRGTRTLNRAGHLSRTSSWLRGENAPSSGWQDSHEHSAALCARRSP